MNWIPLTTVAVSVWATLPPPLKARMPLLPENAALLLVLVSAQAMVLVPLPPLLLSVPEPLLTSVPVPLKSPSPTNSSVALLRIWPLLLAYRL